LFTHVLDQSGKQLQKVDDEGPFRHLVETDYGDRQALPPSSWEVGKVYVDEQDFELDSNLSTPEIILGVGIWRDKARLPVISGPSDQASRGLVAHVPVANAKQARAAADNAR
jgi:hypothetical protein